MSEELRDYILEYADEQELDLTEEQVQRVVDSITNHIFDTIPDYVDGVI